MAIDQRDTWCQMTPLYGADIGAYTYTLAPYTYVYLWFGSLYLYPVTCTMLHWYIILCFHTQCTLFCWSYTLSSAQSYTQCIMAVDRCDTMQFYTIVHKKLHTSNWITPEEWMLFEMAISQVFKFQQLLCLDQCSTVLFNLKWGQVTKGDDATLCYKVWFRFIAHKQVARFMQLRQKIKSTTEHFYTCVHSWARLCRERIYHNCQRTHSS